MYMRTIALGGAALLAALPLLALAAGSSTGFREAQAQAFFSSVQGCEDVVVGVSVVETEKTQHGPTAPTQAFVFGIFNNICDIGASFSFADVVTLDNGEFTQHGVTAASLDLRTNIGGFEVAIDLDWEGVGKTDKGKNRIHIKNDAMIVHDSDVIANRAADITGTFLVNGSNYAAGTPNGGLSTIRAHTVEIQK